MKDHYKGTYVGKWKVSLLQRPVVLGMALIGTASIIPDDAFAKSAGCTNWSYTGSTTAVSSVNSAHEVNETPKIKLTNNNGYGLPYVFTYTDIANGNQTVTRNGTVNANDTVTATITIPRDTTSGRLSLVVNNGNAPILSIELSCDEAVEPVPGTTEKSQSTTSSTVVSSVSRSQTTVISQNIGARLSAVGTSAGTATGGSTSGGGSVGNSGDNDSNADFFYDPAYHRSTSSSLTEDNNGLRRIAMMGSFDSSTGQGMHLLGLGPTDQGNSGGASGIDGRSAFTTTTPFTVWGHGSFTSVDNDYVNGTTDNRYNGDVWGYNIGLDYRFTDALIAGVSLGYNDTDLTTSFNNGSYKETGWVVSPYVIYRPMENLTITGEAGYGMGDIDVTRDNGAVSGNTESDMWYAAFTASYKVRPMDTLPASLTSSLALIAARKTVDGYTESDGTNNATIRSNTRQIKPSIEAAYDFNPTQHLTVTPFLETGLIYDFTDEINNDKTAFNIGGGVRLSNTLTGLNAALEGSYLAGRSDYTQYTIGGTVTYGFALRGQDGRAMGIVTPFFTSNLNEYGNQRMRTGLRFNTGRLTSELALSHMMSLANDDDNHNSDTSAIEITMSLPL
ncbi:MAG TPA: autotransporter outer membrane beta-barrel domain-containing protein [Methylophaga aminisulfidivorans]|uniref:autotransporter outer membrane beta-barrel domain-containing protein n=3 Tax=Piscirickettsiaceae TaxID=135616 RepID=UPI001A147B70|nr:MULTISPECIES: autotransporter outer membrane beta-barrel domain-containing protein [Methylophaga]HIM38444.1 autotransporter outer membrane beta-barrel domain-containing protein [Methylophaga aminisulfidivorans]